MSLKNSTSNPQKRKKRIVAKIGESVEGPNDEDFKEEEDTDSLDSIPGQNNTIVNVVNTPKKIRGRKKKIITPPGRAVHLEDFIETPTMSEDDTSSFKKCSRKRKAPEVFRLE